MSFDRSIFIGKFTQEAKELIQTLNNCLLQLEKNPQSHEMIKDILRIAHTLKGSSKMMRFHNLNQLSHKIEDLLIAVQDRHIPLTVTTIELLFQSTDLISQCVEMILSGEENSVDIRAICDVLEHAANDEDISSMMSQFHSYSQTDVEGGQRQGGQFSISEDCGSRSDIQETIRVDVDRLDNAIRLVGEIAVSRRKSEHRLLVLKELQRVARNHTKHLYQFVQGNNASELMQESLHILKGIERTFKENRDEIAMMEIVIGELYEDVLRMRMLPLSTVFDTFPRAVRDMAQYFQKKIELRITGADTTLDKKIIEQLNTPLIHILRNCVDHGIESPQERMEQGKPASGMLSIDAYRRSGQITIEISDDGRGIQCETLKQQAIRRGMLSEETARALDKKELLNLAFLPRVSTSPIITDISGRGMGMDIVKANIEHLKGSVSLQSELGKGTTCVLTLPMTLTTLRSLIISSQQKRFAVPINSVAETLQVASHDIIQMPEYKAIRLRDQIIYLVDLADVLGLERESFGVHDHHFVLIVQAEGKRIALIVDEILDEQEIVIKQLPAHMQRVKTISGGTISNDNTVMLILHIPEVVEFVQHT